MTAHFPREILEGFEPGLADKLANGWGIAILAQAPQIGLVMKDGKAVAWIANPANKEHLPPGYEVVELPHYSEIEPLPDT